MEAPRSLLSEEKFLCSVCLDVFTQPVTTPCGHNFCSACIQKYWDSSNICLCPLCKREFPQRPELQVNTVVSELAAELKKLVEVKASSPEPQLSGSAQVLCDICSKTKRDAVKSCLMCLVSFCDEHLEPHNRVAALKAHKLLEPVKNLDDRMCKTHNKLAELYCRTEHACVCVLCFKTDHKSHDVVPLEEEYEAMMAKKDDTMTCIQNMIRTRSEKMVDFDISLDVRQKEAEKEIKASVQVFADLIRSILKSQAELVDAIEERCRAAKHKTDGFLADLRVEVAELQSRSSQLEQLSQSQDHHGFLQSFPALSSPPLNKDWTNVSVHSNLCFGAVRGAVTALKQRVCEIIEEVPEIKMKRMRDHAVDLTFDPDTAYSSLVISPDGKQVVDTAIQQTLPQNPKRFDMCSDVLAKEGFTTGRFYYEVQVKGKTEWIVGVVRESVNRKENIALSVKNGAWNMGFDGSVYTMHTCPNIKITLKEELQKVGIFVDYNEGLVSFYDANSKSHIYSFTRCFFTEKLFPYFGLQGNVNGTNAVPLIISPVPLTN